MFATLSASSIMNGFCHLIDTASEDGDWVVVDDDRPPPATDVAVDPFEARLRQELSRVDRMLQLFKSKDLPFSQGNQFEKCRKAVLVVRDHFKKGIPQEKFKTEDGLRIKHFNENRAVIHIGQQQDPLTKGNFKFFKCALHVKEVLGVLEIHAAGKLKMSLTTPGYARELSTAATREYLGLRPFIGNKQSRIVQLFEFEQRVKKVYFYPELIPNFSLNFYMSGSTKEQVAVWVKDIIQCLKELKKNNIAHCDIKPDNFLIGEDGRLKLIDFSFSVDPRQLSRSVNGSVAFMAPERFWNVPIDTPVDAYAAGITLYMLKIGKDEPANIFIHDKNSRFISVQALANDLKAKDNPFDKLIGGLLEGNQHKRLTVEEAEKLAAQVTPENIAICRD